MDDAAQEELAGVIPAAWLLSGLVLRRRKIAHRPDELPGLAAELTNVSKSLDGKGWKPPERSEGGRRDPERSEGVQPHPSHLPPSPSPRRLFPISTLRVGIELPVLDHLGRGDPPEAAVSLCEALALREGQWAWVGAWQQVTEYEFTVSSARTLKELTSASPPRPYRVISRVQPTLEGLVVTHEERVDPEGTPLRMVAEAAPRALEVQQFVRKPRRPWSRREDMANLASDMWVAHLRGQRSCQFAAKGSVAAEMDAGRRLVELLRKEGCDMSEHWENHERVLGTLAAMGKGEWKPPDTPDLASVRSEEGRRDPERSEGVEQAASPYPANLYSYHVAEVSVDALPPVVRPEQVRYRFEKEFHAITDRLDPHPSWRLRVVVEAVSYSGSFCEAERCMAAGQRYGSSSSSSSSPASPLAFVESGGSQRSGEPPPPPAPSLRSYVVLEPVDVEGFAGTLPPMVASLHLLQAALSLNLIPAGAALLPDPRCPSAAALWRAGFLARGVLNEEARAVQMRYALEAAENAQRRKLCCTDADILSHWGPMWGKAGADSQLSYTPRKTPQHLPQQFITAATSKQYTTSGRMPRLYRPPSSGRGGEAGSGRGGEPESTFISRPKLLAAEEFENARWSWEERSKRGTNLS